MALKTSPVIKQGFNPLAFRYWLLSGHYRAHFNFSMNALGSTSKALQCLPGLLLRWPQSERVDDGYKEKFIAYINEDLKISQALALLWEVTKSSLRDADKGNNSVF